MSKNILIAGKPFPASTDLADSFAINGYNVTAASTPDNSATSTGAGTKLAPWNSGSAISARSLLIQAETNFGYTDNAILYFDSDYFVSQFPVFSTDVCSKISDTMICGFQFLTLELLNRIQQKNQKCRIIFILKTHPTVCDFAKSSALRKAAVSPASPLVGAAEAAFATFAENIAAISLEHQNLSTLLITGDSQNEFLSDDSTLASWLASTIESLDSAKKESKSVSWTKAGSKPSSGLSLFH